MLTSLTLLTLLRLGASDPDVAINRATSAAPPPSPTVLELVFRRVEDGLRSALDRLSPRARALVATPLWTTSGTPFCDGAQTAFGVYAAAIPCPCGTTSAVGSGCPNAAGTNATLVNSGTDSVAAADCDLVTTGIPPNKLCFTYFGQNVAGGTNPIGIGYGNGIRCINETYRLDTLNSGVNGTINYLLFQSNLPNGFTHAIFASGSTWLFQTFYRDNPISGCGTKHENMSNGWSITFTL